MTDPSPTHDSARADAEKSLRRALVVSAVPMGIAVLICLGWWWWRWLIFPILGLLLLIVGLVAFLYSITQISHAEKQMRASGTPASEAFGKRLKMASFMAVGSFPFAAVCAAFGIFLFRSCLIVIENRSSLPVTGMMLTDRSYGQPTEMLGDLKPGERRRFSSPQGGDAGPLFSAKRGGTSLERYLSSFDGRQRLDLTIRPDGGVTEEY